jgi:hypothetical protein
MTLLTTFPTNLIFMLAVFAAGSFVGFLTTKNAYGKNTWFQRNHILIGIISTVILVLLIIWKMKY